MEAGQLGRLGKSEGGACPFDHYDCPGKLQRCLGDVYEKA